MPLVFPNPMIAGAAGLKVLGTATSTEEGAVSSHSVAIPDGPTGSMLVVLFRTGGSPLGHSTPSGWSLVDNNNAANNTLISAFSRTDPGGLGSSVSITTNATRRSASICFRIVGHQGDIEGDITNTDTLDCPLLSPSWGSDRTLWIPVGSCRNSFSADVAITDAPAGYTDNFLAERTTSGSTDAEAAIGASWRIIETATENPGAFSASSFSDALRSGTIAVR